MSGQYLEEDHDHHSPPPLQVLISAPLITTLPIQIGDTSLLKSVAETVSLNTH